MEIKTKEIYRDENIAIELDEKLRFIYVEWQRHVKSQEFRNLFSEAAALALNHKCHYWLSDARLLHFIDFSDQNWMLREMAPLLLKSDLKKFARVSNRESMSLMDVHRVYDELKNNMPASSAAELEIFLDKEDALNWLFDDFE